MQEYTKKKNKTKLYIFTIDVSYGMYIGTMTSESLEDAKTMIEVYFLEKYMPYNKDYAITFRAVWNLADNPIAGQGWIDGFRE